MKNKLLKLIIVLVLSANNLYSQEAISTGDHKIGKNVFNVEETDDLKGFFIKNLKDTLIREDNPDLLFVDRNLVNISDLKSLIWQTLKKRNNNLKLKNAKLKVFCSFFPNGKIQSLSYVINSRTEFTLHV